jgi:hypothetical protein
MKIKISPLFAAVFAPLAAFAAREGTPVYYQNQSANAYYQPAYQNQGYTSYVGQNSQKQVVGQRQYTYQVPSAQNPGNLGAMTPNGVAMPADSESPWVITADYARRFADFQFETGVNSILEWDDMVMNEIGFNVQHNFQMRNYDLFAFAEYRYGTLSNGGLSMDYDLKPYDERYPNEGIFTISMGDQSGTTNHYKFGFGAKHVWDVAGWKLSPSIGYEVFQHNLEMSNHIYPNPGVYLPLMNQYGEYIYGDSNGQYYSIGQGVAPPAGFFQVCLSPEDIMVARVDPITRQPILVQTGVDVNGQPVYGPDTQVYNPVWLDLPWGVGPGECVVIGGDGMIVVPGTTHIYNTTWSGIYFGLEMEKQMTYVDKLRFYFQLGLPSYSAEGTWPNRTDWQQNPSFIDKGSNGAYSYRLEMEYNYRLSDRMQLMVKADTDYFYVGKIPGELYVAEYSVWLVNQNGDYILDTNGLPVLEKIPAHTEHISDSLKSAVWQSFGLHLGVKYSF